MSTRSAILRELRPTLALAFPIVVGQVGQMLMGITDSVMIGRIGAVPLAASAFANGVCNLVFIVGIGLLLPVAILSARAHGAREPRECAEFLRHGIALAWTVGFTVVIGLFIVSTQLDRFGQPVEVVAEVGPYYLLLASSLLPAFIFQAFKQYSEALGRPWAPMVILLSGVLLNVFLNWVLIYGRLGFPALGLAGAGWATLTARTMAVLIVWRWLGRHKSIRAEWPTHALAPEASDGRAPRGVFALWFSGLSRARFRAMMHIGVPTAGQWLFEAGAFSAAAFMMGWLGTVPLAAHQIALSCASFTFMFPLGLSVAAGVRVSKALGEGRRDALRPIGFGALAAGVVAMSFFGMIFALGGGVIARGFTPELAVVGLAAQLLIVAGVFQVFDGAQVIGAGALRGMSDVKIPTLLTFVAYWIVALPGGYFLSHHTAIGAVGVWVALAAGLGSAALLLGWRFHRLTAAMV